MKKEGTYCSLFLVVLSSYHASQKQPAAAEHNLDVHVYHVYNMHVSRAPSFQILQHLWKSYSYIEEALSAAIEQELFELDLVEHPLFSSKNNIKSEEKKQLRQQIVGNYRE